MTKHSRERALERYNIKLSKQDEIAIIDKIRLNLHIPLNLPTKESNMKFAYIVHNNIPLKVLYSRSNKGVKEIITVYPFDADEYNEVMQDDFKNKIDLAIKFLKKNKYIVYKRNVKEAQ